jgi:hypothetical protein
MEYVSPRALYLIFNPRCLDLDLLVSGFSPTRITNALLCKTSGLRAMVPPVHGQYEQRDTRHTMPASKGVRHIFSSVVHFALERLRHPGK